MWPSISSRTQGVWTTTSWSSAVMRIEKAGSAHWHGWTPAR